MTAALRLRDAFAAYVPLWLSDRVGRNVGFRVIWTFAAACDANLEVLVRGIQAAWPGVGDPSALGAVGASRGIVRGLGDTNATYATRLLGWLGQHSLRGSSRELARQVQAYLPHRPLVRVITRWGWWTSIDSAGVITTTTAAWDWDSVSNPERNTAAAPWWSDLFVVIYPDPYAKQASLGSGLVAGGTNEGFGHKCPIEQYDALAAILAEWKAGHSRVRAVIWSPDPTYFVPGGVNVPNGRWGQWSMDVAGVREVSSRFSDCRFWEF
jgi:hypothetical protein